MEEERFWEAIEDIKREIKIEGELYEYKELKALYEKYGEEEKIDALILDKEEKYSDFDA